MASESASVKARQAELFVISLLSLYIELVIIRWLSSEIRIFAYFKNVPLMACLFGLGLGMALSQHKRDLTRWFPAGLLVITAIICFAAPLHLVHISFLNPLEHYLIGQFNTGSEAHNTPMDKLALFVPGLGVLVGVFYLLVFTFACIGQRLGKLFNDFPPLSAYSLNVAASLIGILLFSFVSFISLTPPVWLLIGILVSAYFYRRIDQLAAFAAALVIAFATANPQVMWSPYYRITLDQCTLQKDGEHAEQKYGYNINVNYDTIEGAYNNNPKFISSLSATQRKATADYYDVPYQALGDKPRSILVLAAGTGNDVAAALRHGATDVDAVEIDPTIAKIGREMHPEQPYSNSSVNLIVNDARAYLRRSKKKYDLIVFAYLDSHTAFSSMSSLRLDNYVYTKESFQDAYKLLKPDGVISVTFYYLNWWQLAHVYRAFEQGTKEQPIGVFSAMGNGPTLLVGPGLDRQKVEQCGLKPFTIDQASKDWKFDANEWSSVDPTTDDWPYLFLRDKSWSWTYGIGILFTLFLGYWLVGRCFGRYASDATGKTMFFLGAAFMLIETKSVTQMGLLLGTTWFVNSAVITAVLIMILLANLIQMKYRFKRREILFGLLFASLLFNCAFPLSSLNDLETMTRSLLGATILSAPLLFAAMIFAITFSEVKSPDKALGMNLLGTLVGGALEYLSMMFGVNAMNVIAIVLYALAYFYSRKIATENASPQTGTASSAAQ
jgi:SAM-dependent methyltransferase